MKDVFRYGRWIWSGDSEPNTYTYFAKRFVYGAGGGAPRLRVSADTRYILYLNGTPIGRGPVQSQPYYQYYDTYRDALPLTSGENVLSAVVYYLGRLEGTRGGFLLEMDADGSLIVASDCSWKAKRSDAWRSDTFYFRFNHQAPYQEIFDARREPDGWPNPSIESWQDAEEIPGRPPQAGPWSRLLPRDIPHMRAAAVVPEGVSYVEESIAEDHRLSPFDLTLELSKRGKDIEHTVLRSPEALLSAASSDDEAGQSVSAGVASQAAGADAGGGSAAPTIWRCSNKHLDRVFDGMYDPCIVLDFGKILTAYLQIDIELPEGASVDVGFTERLTDGSFVNSIENKYAARFTSAGGRQVFQTFNWMSFRFVKLRLKRCVEESALHSVRAVTVSYPFEERGLFHSSEALLNRIWSLSRYTIDLCSKEAIMDTPWREQAQWLGDVSAVTLGGIYACYGDTLLPSKFLKQSAANLLPIGVISNISNSTPTGMLRTITDYSLWWIAAVWEHYLYAGDEELLVRLYPVVLRIIQTMESYMDENGLAAWIPHWVFVDWADIDTRGECAAYNAMIAVALTSAARIAEVYGDDRLTRHASALLSTIRENFVSRFYDRDRGLFADANIDGELSSKVSEHANLLAVGQKLCNPELSARILDTIYENDQLIPGVTRAEPFFTWQVLKTLTAAGRFQTAMAILRRRWGWMVDRGQTSASEEWGRHGSFRNGEEYATIVRTESHAWSASPAEFLTRILIGLEILEPGCRKLRIQPRTEGVPSYLVRYPTPLGTLVVENKDGEVTHAAPPEVEVIGPP